MAVVFRTFAISNNQTTATTTFTITIPASVQTGDDLYVLAVSRDHTAGTAKYTCTDNDAGGNTWFEETISTDRKTTLFWKKATSGTASKTITLSGGVGSFTGGLSVFYGACDGDPTANLTLQQNSSGTETHASITPAYNNSYVVFGVTNDTNDLDITLGASANLGTLEPEQWASESTGGSDCKATMFGILMPVAGPTGTFSWAQTNATTDSIAFSIMPGVSGDEAVTVTDFLEDIIIDNTRMLTVFESVSLVDEFFKPFLEASVLDNITVSENGPIPTRVLTEPLFLETVSVVENISLVITLVREYEYISIVELADIVIDGNRELTISDSVSVSEDISADTFRVIDVFDSVAVSEYILQNTFEFGVYDTVAVTPWFTNIPLVSHQMPFSRPRGSLGHTFDAGGSTNSNIAIINGGVL